MTPSLEDREAIAYSLGVVKCEWCDRICPYCPRLIAVRPDLAPVVQRSEPSLVQKAANFAGAVVEHVVTGWTTIDTVASADRLEICGNCSNYNNANNSCIVCGCRMNIKVRWAEQKCPIGKW